jgi:uncharacterized protein (DUF433 family)
MHHLAERELRKLDKISRLSAAPCDSAAFTRAFNSARNGKDQANKAFDRLRAAAELTHAGEPTPTSRKKRATKAEPEREFHPEPGYGPRIRDTPFQVGQVASMMEHGWPDQYILNTCPGVTADDLRDCREELARGTVRRGIPLPKQLELLHSVLFGLIGVVLTLLFARGLMSFPRPARTQATLASVADFVPQAVESAADPETGPSVGGHH